MSRRLLMALAIAITSTVASMPGVAGPSDWLGKTGRAVRDAPTGTALRPLSRAEAIGMAGSSAILVEIQDGSILLHSISTGASAVAGAAEDLAGVARRLADASGLATPHRGVYALTRETALALGNGLDDLAATGTVHIVERGLGAMPLRRLPRPDGSLGRFREIRPGLVVELEQALTKEVVDLLASAVARERIRVLSLFDAADVDSVRRLAEVAGERLVDVSALRGAEGGVTLAGFRDDIVVAVGHVEDGAFVTRTATGAESGRMPVDALESAATDADATLLSAGCSCYVGGPSGGYLGPVSDVGVAASLERVFAAGSHADLLAAFGDAEAPFAITNDTLAGLAAERVLALQRLGRHQGKVDAAAAVLRLTAPRARTDALAVLGGLGAMATVSFAAMFRLSRAAFLRLSPVAPSARLAPTRAMILRAGREALFFVIGPVIALAVVASFLVGCWSYRATAHEYLWSAVFTPVEFLILTVDGLSGLVFFFGMLGAFLVPGALFVVDFAASPEPLPHLAWVLMALAAPAFALAGWWACWRLPGRVADWVAVQPWSRSRRVLAFTAAAVVVPASVWTLNCAGLAAASVLSGRPLGLG